MASHRRPALEGTDLRTHTPALQRRNTLRVTSKATYEGRATEQCATPSVCTALSLGQAPTGQSKQTMSASWQSINQSIMHAHLVWKGKAVTVSVPPRPDLRVRSQSSAVMLKRVAVIEHHG